MRKDRENRFKLIVVIWIILVIHINLIVTIMIMGKKVDVINIAEDKIESILDKKYSEIEEKLDKKYEELKELGEVTKIYSDCAHKWREIGESPNGCYKTFTCDNCGTIQVINICEESIYINVK